MGFSLADVLLIFDEIEDYNDDADKQHLIAPPPEWGEYKNYDMATSAVKMLFVLYRRIEKIFHQDAKVRVKITGPGQRRCMAQLGLGPKPGEEGYDSSSVNSGATPRSFGSTSLATPRTNASPGRSGRVSPGAS